MSYAVVPCASCREPWAVDLRHASASCPACGAKAELAGHARLWQGATPQEAQAAAATLRLGRDAAGRASVAALSRPLARDLPRHDSPLDAAAAQGGGIRNLSARAEAVAQALCRLGGTARHDDLVQALLRAGLDGKRSEAEVVRMLATDLLVEPRPGAYRFMV